MVHVPVQKVTAMPGRKVQLECNVDSFPRAEISWEFSPERGEVGVNIQTDDRWGREKMAIMNSTVLF